MKKLKIKTIFTLGAICVAALLFATPTSAYSNKHSYSKHNYFINTNKTKSWEKDHTDTQQTESSAKQPTEPENSTPANSNQNEKTEEHAPNEIKTEKSDKTGPKEEALTQPEQPTTQPEQSTKQPDQPAKQLKPQTQPEETILTPKKDNPSTSTFVNLNKNKTQQTILTTLQKLCAKITTTKQQIKVYSKTIATNMSIRIEKTTHFLQAATLSLKAYIANHTIHPQDSTQNGIAETVVVHIGSEDESAVRAVVGDVEKIIKDNDGSIFNKGSFRTGVGGNYYVMQIAFHSYSKEITATIKDELNKLAEEKANISISF